MKKVILVLIALPFPLFSQIAENFESGSISGWLQSSPGRWAADNSSPISGSFSLHHIFDNPDSGNDQIAMPVRDLHPALAPARWSFRVRHGYEPSSSNNWALFLMSDNNAEEMRPGGNVNGYAIGVNLSGYDDTLRLWKIVNGNVLPILSTGLNWQSSVGISANARITVERSPEGAWRVSAVVSSGFSAGPDICFSPELFPVNYTGIFYRYSSTRDRLLWVDDIELNGCFLADTVPPGVSSVTVTGKSIIDLIMDEEPDNHFGELSNVMLNNGNTGISGIRRTGTLSFRITCSDPLVNKSDNTLLLKRACDRAGNCTENLVAHFTPLWADPGDIVISEIMADPSPSVALPEREYIEIKNNTRFVFNLSGWKITTNAGAAGLDKAAIDPGAYMILCAAADTAVFKGMGRFSGIKSFPSLNDSGEWLVLTDNEGNLIHGVEYSRKWFSGTLKSSGGWSLEMIDPLFPFSGQGNWSASLSRTGGTPGKANSVSRSNPDTYFSGIMNAFAPDSLHIEISFGESVLNLLTHAGEIRAGGKEVKKIIMSEALCRIFTAELLSPLERGKIYELKVPAFLADMSGNRAERTSARTGLTEAASVRDIIFNELLFDPLPGDPDFIEFRNCSSKIINAASLFLASVDDGNADTSALFPVSETDRCIFPGNLYTLTTDRESLTARYPAAADSGIFEVSQLPSMPDDEGHLVLFNRQLDIIDEVRYSKKMHFALLTGTEGISLERTAAGPGTVNGQIWHSASESAGWATPGSENSVSAGNKQGTEGIYLSSTRITPDNDGNEDRLIIDLNLSGYDNAVTVYIFDERGRRVKKLAENLMAGQRAVLVWDGSDDNYSLVDRGIYVVYVSVFGSGGERIINKKACSVLR